MQNKLFTMKEASQITGLSYDTIKFYCNKGLVPNVQRDKNNYRVFDEKMVSWLDSLSCLKKCGMSIKDMQQYLAYCLEGEASIPQRQAMLAAERVKLVAHLKEIEDSIAYIDSKQAFYHAVLNSEIPYVSNLTM